MGLIVDDKILKRANELLEQAKRWSDPFEAEEMVERAQGLLRQACLQPAPGSGAIPAGSPYGFDQIHPPAKGLFIQPMIAPDRFYVVPVRPLVVAGGVQSNPIKLDFQSKAGWLIGMRGKAADFNVPGTFAAGALEQASMGVNIRVNDDESLITNTTDTAFSAYSDLFGNGDEWCPILRELTATDTLTIRYVNFQPAVGGVSLVPSLTFQYRLREYPGSLNLLGG